MKAVNVAAWKVEEVVQWVKSLDDGLCELAPLFAEHRIDGKVLISLTENDLRAPPMSLSRLGDVKHLYNCIVRVRGTAPPHTTSPAESPIPSPDQVVVLSPRMARGKGHLFRLGVAVAYWMFAVLATSFSLVTAHERVPEKDSYPPLPDLILDNVPLIPWAFAASEIFILFLLVSLVTILALHKFRVIILTRFLCISATVFLLRCVTMLATSLSVPGEHLDCPPLKLDSFEAKVHRALTIAKGLGASCLGVETCGDYMFSGHCTMLTLLACFVCEYTPVTWQLFHRICWGCAVFGMFCVVAAHEHYSIDCLLGFYISSRVFGYYHSLANQIAAMTREERARLSVWFPLLAYFEQEAPHCGHGNEYDLPKVVHTMLTYRKAA